MNTSTDAGANGSDGSRAGFAETSKRDARARVENGKRTAMPYVSDEGGTVQRVIERTGLRDMEPRQLNKALGWFSIGLGLTELLAPRALGRLIGAGQNHSAITRLCGVREIASGMGLLSQRAPASAAMSRVVGDAMDLALLAAALRSPDAQPARLLAATTAVLGVMAADVYATGRHARNALAEADEAVPARTSLAINSTPEKLYAFWRELTNLPRFMERLQSVHLIDEKTSHWVATAPGGVRLEWDSEIVDDQPNSLLAWRTRPGSEVRHHGSVRFEPAGDGRGTIVHVDMEYGAIGGKAGAALARIFGEDPQLQMARDLRAFKQIIETGEVATTRGQPAGARSLVGRILARGES